MKSRDPKDSLKATVPQRTPATYRDVGKAYGEAVNADVEAVKKAMETTTGIADPDLPISRGRLLTLPRVGSPARRRAEKALASAAAHSGAEIDDLARILLGHGDLEYWIGHYVSREADLNSRLATVNAVRKVGEVLIGARWPFDEWNTEGVGHPLSSQVLKPILEANRREGETIAQDLKAIKTERQKRGINKNPKSAAYDKAAVIRAIGREILDHLLLCAFKRQFPNVQNASNANQETVRKSLGRSTKQQLAEDACAVVNAAFPTVARLDPKRLQGSYPK